MEDIKIGRKEKYTWRTIANGTAIGTIPGNASRTRLIIGNTSGVLLQISDSPGIGVNALNFPTSGPYNTFVLRVEEYGTWLLGQLYATTGDSNPITVLDIYLDTEDV